MFRVLAPGSIFQKQTQMNSSGQYSEHPLGVCLGSLTLLQPSSDDEMGSFGQGEVEWEGGQMNETLIQARLHQQPH